MLRDILDAAEKMFREHGYLRVTVADIAKMMGMSPGNIYRFFDSKSALREALAERLTRQVEAVCQKVADGAGNAAERLSELVVEYHHMTLDRYLSAANVNELLDNAMHENWNVIDAHMMKMRAMIQSIIESGLEEGVFVVRDPEMAARMVFYSIIPFVDPHHVARWFVNDNLQQARKMGAFITGALTSGSI